MHPRAEAEQRGLGPDFDEMVIPRGEQGRQAVGKSDRLARLTAPVTCVRHLLARGKPARQVTDETA